MPQQLTNNPEALRLFFTEDIFLVNELPVVNTTQDVGSESKQVQEPESQVHISLAQTAPAEIKIEIPHINNEESISQIKVSAQPAVQVPVIDTAIPSLQNKEVSTSVQIPETQVAQLSESIADTSEPIEPFKYVGANERNILILVYDTVNPVSSIPGRQLLGMILKSINLDRNDCALVNYASCGGADFTSLNTFFKPQYVFAFGVTAAQLGLEDFATNSIVNHSGTKLIFSVNLDALSEDPATKKLLWASLKQIQLK